MRKIIILALMALSGCATLPCGDTRLLQQYSLEIEKAEFEIKKSQVDWQKLNAHARQLSDLGTDLLFEYRRRHPKCSEFVDTIIAHQGEMLGQGLSQLERLYHEGEGLPQTELECLAAKDIIVRPQTLRVLIREQSETDYLSEMLGEINLLRTSFTQFSQHYKTSSNR